MSEFDVIILGAGPAGLSAAHRLATFGHRVALVGRGPSRRQRQLETVPQLAVITHAFPGIRLDAPELVASSRVGISWWTGEATATREVSVVDRGSVSEPGFDAQLFAHCLRSKITSYLWQRVATKVAFDQVWHVCSGGISLRSRFLIDATGRHSSLRSRRPLTPWNQAVITSQLRLSPDTPDLWTESLPEGWLWAIRDQADQWSVSLFVDPTTLKEGRSVFGQRFLTQSRLANQFRSPLPTCWAVREASPVATATVFSRGLLHVGDAALARCPLASQGLSAAISDGQCAAVALHSLIQSSTPESVVSDFLETRHRQATQRHVNFLAASYASTPYQTAYWQCRAKPGSLESTAPAALPDLDQTIELGANWKLRSHPTLEENCIQLAPCLCSEEETLRWLAGHPINDLLSPLVNRTPVTVRTLLTSWAANRQLPEQTTLLLLQWLSQRRVLVPA